MALLGYAIVSTRYQKLTLQTTDLKSIGIRDDRIFTDMISRATDGVSLDIENYCTLSLIISPIADNRWRYSASYRAIY